MDIRKIQRNLRETGEVAVAYSGGVDSTLLTYLCKTAGTDYIALIVDSQVMAREELQNAVEVAQKLDFNYKVVEVDLLSSQKFVENTSERCYHCKKRVLSVIRDFAENRTIVEGTNADDLKEHRPGIRAVEEIGAVSPLKNFTKKEIINAAKEYNLPNWNKPSNSCLATRITDREITEGELRRIEEAEDILKEQGFKLVRARVAGDRALIQVAQNRLDDLFEVEDVVKNRIKKLGFRQVSVDSEGYPSTEL